MSAAVSLKKLFAGYALPVPDVTVTGIAMDSRRVAAGDLFVACHGRGTHGLAHLEQAIERGAAAVAWEPASGWTAPATDLPEVAVPALSRRVGEIAARFYGEPSRAMYCVGVTGTDGKTSTAYLLAQALECLAEPCAYVGTLGIGRIDALSPNTHTTPDPVQLQRQLAAQRAGGVGACAMEVSSHALDQDRVSGVVFETAVLTNITRDHLDYHGTVEHYAAAKRRLFERDGLKVAVLNRDDAAGARWADELAVDVVEYGVGGDPSPRRRSVIAQNVRCDIDGIGFDVHTSWGDARITSSLLGRFNAYNLMAVLAVLLSRGVVLDRAVEVLGRLHTVPGRIEGFRGREGAPLVVVDYAHTPEALAQVLQALRAHTPRRLVCVFGCGGDRDRGKRPLMGRAAAATADAVIVTDDNPRSEAPEAIVAEILEGIDPAQRGRIRIEHDRAAAIRTAIGDAGSGDIVLVAGKGHERTQTYGAEVRDFSDRHFVAECLGIAPPDAAPVAGETIA